MGDRENELTGIRLRPFAGVNAEEWPTWKPECQAYLDTKNLLDTLIDERPDGDGAPAKRWDRNCRLIFAHLVAHIRGAARMFVMQYEPSRGDPPRARDGVRAWRGLVVKYEQQGTLARVMLCKQLIQLDLSPGHDPDIFIGQAEELGRRLGAVGQQISELLLMGLLLAKLPAVYDPLLMVLETDDTLTYDVVKTRVRAYHSSPQMQGREVTDKALIAHIDGDCYGCGEYGHPEWDCPNEEYTGAGGRGGRGGRRGRGSRGGRGRGGRGGRGDQERPKCQFCDKWGHTAKVCKNIPQAKHPQNKPTKDVAAMAIEEDVLEEVL